MRRILRNILLLALAGATAAAALAARAGSSREITFADLRFPTQPPKQVQVEGMADPIPSFNEQIPEKIRKMSGERVIIEGYMMPLVLDGKKVREFLVVTSPLVCCFGQTPDINEYIVVKMSGEAAPLLENVPLHFEGVLDVGDIYENGYWTGIYAMTCEAVRS